MSESKQKVSAEVFCPVAKDIEAGGDGSEVECKLISEYFCPFAAIPWMDAAILYDLPECPHSWE